MTREDKLERCKAILLEHAPLLIAYSGGVDSAFLLALATDTLGPQTRGIIADSPSLPRRALEDALALAEAIGTQVRVVPTDELENPDYAANPPDRCYFCKAELFRQMENLARIGGFRAIAYGENADDANQIRPGAKAASEFQVLSPLKQAGLTKQEIRDLSRLRGLPTADAPSQPCLSSRIPHGTPVTRDALDMIERAEEHVRSLGFRVFRVRHIVEGNGLPSTLLPAPPLAAKVQIEPSEMHNLTACQDALETGLRSIGYGLVYVDPEGYRTPPANA